MDFWIADLMHTLWEADVAVFKTHITTGPGGKVLDMFWIYDNRCELPENHRCELEYICLFCWKMACLRPHLQHIQRPTNTE